MNESIESKQYIVIGSGPAGVSAAKALLNRQVSVLMLDAGIQLDQHRNNTLNQLQLRWDEKLYAPLKHKIDINNQLKLSYGSNYPYKDVDKHIKIIADNNIRCTPSFACGGLSSVWGAYVAPYNECDLSQWPITASELNPYYQMISDFIPFQHFFQQSEQSSILFQHMQKNSVQLRQSGLSFQLPNLAVTFNGTFNKKACLYCGNCQHGCPNQLIYSSSDTLQELLLHPNFSYQPNCVVEKIVDHQTHISILAHELHNINHKMTVFGKKAFLAAGSIISTHILLNSLDLVQHSVFLKDSQHFMLPCILKKGAQAVQKEKLHTLTQLLLRINNNLISKNTMHLQVYTYMDHYLAQLQSTFKIAYPLLKSLIPHFLNRFILIQGYFHSNESSYCETTLLPDRKTLQLKQHIHLHSRQQMNQLVFYLLKKHRLLGFFPIPGMAKLSKILSANHYGGSFPMQAHPQSKTTTDLLGRPYGMSNLHVVDATVFPTIPAQSITFTVMANAYRIATECPL